MQKRVALKIYGKVQGVFFRDCSRMKAMEFNVVGWIRNEIDGTIDMVVEGKDKDLIRFIEWCKYGPDNASVEKVNIKWLEATGEFDSFTIR